MRGFSGFFCINFENFFFYAMTRCFIYNQPAQLQHYRSHVAIVVLRVLSKSFISSHMEMPVLATQTSRAPTWIYVWKVPQAAHHAVTTRTYIYKPSWKLEQPIPAIIASISNRRIRLVFQTFAVMAAFAIISYTTGRPTRTRSDVCTML